MNSSVKNISEKQRCKMKGRLQKSLDKYQNISQSTKGQGVSIGDSGMIKEIDR